MTRPAEVTSAADWADLVAALRNEIDLIEGFYAGLTAAREQSDTDIDDDQEATDQLQPDRDIDTEQIDAEQEDPVTDRDRQAEQEADREMREDYETDGDLDGDYDPEPPETADPDLEA